MPGLTPRPPQPRRSLPRPLRWTAAIAALAALALLAAPLARAVGAGRPPSFSANRFSVEIDGVLVAGIQSIEGLEAETDVVELKDGGGANARHLRAFYRHPGFVTLTRDFTLDPLFLRWYRDAESGRAPPRTVAVVLHDDAGAEVGRITLTGCIPAKFVGPSFAARSTGGVTESLKIAWESATYRTP
jgi:phage tail-like protein